MQSGTKVSSGFVFCTGVLQELVFPSTSIVTVKIVSTFLKYKNYHKLWSIDKILIERVYSSWHLIITLPAKLGPNCIMHHSLAGSFVLHLHI